MSVHYDVEVVAIHGGPEEGSSCAPSLPSHDVLLCWTVPYVVRQVKRYITEKDRFLIDFQRKLLTTFKYSLVFREN